MIRGGILALSLSLSLSGCESASEPVDPVWGKQSCGECSMLVSDPAHSAQLVTTDGTRLFFDDIGCMATYLEEGPNIVGKLWVRSSDGKWIDARSAKFRSGQKTPMDYGFSAAPDGDADFSQVEAAVRKRKEAR